MSEKRIRRTPAQIKTDAEAISRICTKCSIEKPIKEFRTRPFADGKHTQCKQCTDENSAQHRIDNIDYRKAQQRTRTLKHHYGITPDDYEYLLKRQNESCWLCQKHYTEFRTRLAVDHDHKTGIIRGLLCTNCNHRLIARHTDGELLRRMADYTEQDTGFCVPEQKKKPKPRKRKPTKW